MCTTHLVVSQIGGTKVFRFLDLQMPDEEIDGLAFMNILGNGFHYILTTAHPQYALQSYEYNVVDYLHKPYPFERFLKAAQKAHKLIRANSHNVADDYLYISCSQINKQPDYNEGENKRTTPYAIYRMKLPDA